MKKLILMFAIYCIFAESRAQVMKKPDLETVPSYNAATPEILPTNPLGFNLGAMIVPEKVKEAFNKTFRGRDASWKMEGKDYLATFKSKDKEPLETMVLYDAGGGVLLMEREYKSGTDPFGISKYCDDHMIGKNCRVWEVDAKNETRKYFVSHGNKTMWFDKNGNHISNKEAQMAHNKIKTGTAKKTESGKKTGIIHKTEKRHSSEYYK